MKRSKRNELFPNPITEGPECFSDNIESYFEKYGEDADGHRWEPRTICVCVNCGYEEEIRG